MKKTLFFLIVVIAALLAFNNDTFAQQDLPYFNVTVKGEMCSGLVNGADVYVYDLNGNLLTFGETLSNGVVGLGGNISCTNCYVDIKVYYLSINNISQYGELLNVLRSLTGDNYEICLSSPQR